MSHDNVKYYIYKLSCSIQLMFGDKIIRCQTFMPTIQNKFLPSQKKKILELIYHFENKTLKPDLKNIKIKKFFSIKINI